MDHISVIIVNYNSEKDTSDCLESLSAVKVEDAKLNVIVLDNASREPFELPKNLSTNRFEVMRSESNLGFTGGNNLAIKFALDKYNSDYLLLLNNDTLVDKQFLNALLKHSRQYPTQGMICPKIYFAKSNEFHRRSYTADQKGKVLWYAGGSIDWPNLVAFHRGVDEVDRQHFDRQLTSDFATGCAVLIKREVLEKIGVFDERFFLYLEDVDLSVRAMKAGYEIGFCGASKVWHKNAGSSGGAGSSLHQYYQTRNRVFFGLKHGSWRQRLTTVRYLTTLLQSSHYSEQQAAWDLVFGRLGKRIAL